MLPATHFLELAVVMGWLQRQRAGHHGSGSQLSAVGREQSSTALVKHRKWVWQVKLLHSQSKVESKSSMWGKEGGEKYPSAFFDFITN